MAATTRFLLLSSSLLLSLPFLLQAHKHTQGAEDAYYPAQPYREHKGKQDQVIYPNAAYPRHLQDVDEEMMVEDDDEATALSKAWQWEQEITSVAAAFRQAVLTFNETNAKEKNDNYEPFWPACPIFDAANEAGSSAGCAVLQFFKRFVTDLPQNYSHPMMFLPSTADSIDGTHAKPFLLDTRGKDAPRMLALEDVKDELPTYHLLYRMIFHLVKYTFQTEDRFLAGQRIPELQNLVKGFGQQKTYWMKSPVRGRREPRFTPYGLSSVSDDGETMLIVMRGTLWEEEWNHDFEYNYSPDPLAEQIFPGHVHQGMFKMFKPIYQDVIKEVQRVQPRRIIIGGHSLGGAQALMHGYHIQQVVGPEVRVDALAIGALEGGDQKYANALGETLNQRSLIFVGDGAKDSETDYRLGDSMAQYTCGAYIGCDSLKTGPTGVRWQYARAKVQVPFNARNLPNTARFQQAENISPISGDIPIPSFRNLVAGHICAYQCMLSTAIGDEELDLCYFKDQQDQTGLSDYKLCYFPELLY